VIKIPKDVDMSKCHISDSARAILRDSDTHIKCGVCEDAILLDSLRAYAFDEYDHLGFLVPKAQIDTYDDISVENGKARMLHDEDYCAVYVNETTKRHYLVIYMRFPDYLEDQLYHLLVDNVHSRDWNTWAESREFANVLRYAVSRRRAVAIYCLRELLTMSSTFSDVQNTKVSARDILHVTYNTLRLEYNTCVDARHTIRNACFYKNTYNTKTTDGVYFCELDGDPEMSDSIAKVAHRSPATRILCTEPDARMSINRSKTCSGMPRVVASISQYVRLCCGDRNDTQEVAYGVYALERVAVPPKATSLDMWDAIDDVAATD